MKILAFFTNNNIPAIGLSPTIRIRDLVDNSLVVTDSAMLEVGDGHYQYDFTTYDIEQNYAIRCDGGVILADNERYSYAGNENYVDDIWNYPPSAAAVTGMGNMLKRLLGLMHENIYIDNPIYDNNNNLTSARIRIYSDAASVGTAFNVIGTYEITAPSDGAGRFFSWQQVKI
jgi:hypothetical protein